jgi:hypothetical protein
MGSEHAPSNLETCTCLIRLLPEGHDSFDLTLPFHLVAWLPLTHETVNCNKGDS